VRAAQTSTRREFGRRIAGAVLGAVAAPAALTSCAKQPAAAGSTGGGDRFTVGLTYTPNVQFAPFYVAAAEGYYRDAGLDVGIRHHGASEDLFGAMTSGREDIVYAGGDEMLQARAKGLPVVDVATLYQRYPVALIVPEDSGIRTPADLKGRTIGTPGAYGETYFGLLALLKAGGLTEKDATVKYIGFTQQAALMGHKVDGVMGYVNNDAVAFEQAGQQVRTVGLPSGAGDEPLVGVGLGVEASTLTKRGHQVSAFVKATLRGVQYVTDHPAQAVQASEQYVPGLRDAKQRATASAVLKATIPLWQSPAGRPGYNDPRDWDAMARFMYEQGLLDTSITAKDAYDNGHLPASS
jgi:NitT/TauT family transport system substrate-binding protein